MKATIEFDLPAEHDAYLDAINGTRWKQMLGSFEWSLVVLRTIEENDDARKAYEIVLRKLRDARGDAGLIYATAKSWKQEQICMDKFWSKQLDDYLTAQGIPEMMAEMRKESRTHTTSKRKKSKIEKADEKSGVQGNSPATEPE